MAKVPSWPRVVMNRELDRLIGGEINRFKKLNCLEVSGDRWKVSGPNGKHISINFPEFDICRESLNEKFNLIIAEMVFEHLAYPYRAGHNIYDMLDTPGMFVITVPFLYPIHNHPIDCTRWTRTGLKYFLTECGFDETRIYTDSWGNRDCAAALTPEPIEYDEAKHSLINDPNYPISIWAIANK